MMAMSRHRGPLPDPDTLAGYESTLKGSAERIMQSMEREQKARHDVLRGAMISRFVGQAIAAVIAVGAIGCTAFAIYTGHADSAAWIIGPTLGSGTVIALVSGRRPPKEKEEDSE